ncbi:hypothetical protein ACHHYP_08277 [Achlya hypogyna]|uniref:Methyltransferase domain-containing protein n=1 Tax=Achlya hypogyna TaxID=1202772 RepID=A0A1V9ZL61_ACHHY|nr:hypothetical protein ACHHYP_08277 [Achlya hypogyna]
MAATAAKLDALVGQYPMHLYPRLRPFVGNDFAIGEDVYVTISPGKSKKVAGRLFGRARVLDTAPVAFPDRIKIEYSGGSTYHAQPSRLIPQFFRPTPDRPTGVLVTAETSHYRRLARTQVYAHDIVIEIGCDLGATVEILSETVGVENAIGIDKSTDSIAVAKATYPKCQFIELDIFHSSADLLALAQNCTKILIDINGNRLLGAVVDALNLVLSGCPKLDLVIVKSVELHKELTKRRVDIDAVGSA